MNDHDDKQKPSENTEPGDTAAQARSFEPESANPQEAPDFRETAEGGYGWGV
ncbi:MAG: hypothetical protein JJE39_06105 [Vicinamibacteria bacterium]|nr:hypothetical protein [Vicinamibacteria bacterium]